MSPGRVNSCEKTFKRSLAGCLLLLVCILLFSLLQQQQPHVTFKSDVSHLVKTNKDIIIQFIRKLYLTNTSQTVLINNSASHQPSDQVDFVSPNKTIWKAPGQVLFQEHIKQVNKLDLGAPKYQRVCYYTLPGANVTDHLQPEDLDPFLCTHVILMVNCFINDTIHLINETVVIKNLGRMLALKTLNPELKVLMSLSEGFSELVANKTAVRIFAYNARIFVEQHGLDGLDLDWEFPAWSPDPQNGEKERFVYLVDQLSTSLRLVEPSYLLTAAIAGMQPMLDGSYDIPGLARNVDYLSLMGYDYHIYQWYLPFTGHNAPLKAHSSAQGALATLNVEWSVRALLQRGLPKEKLLVGVPIYGRTWRLVSSKWQGLNAPASGPGFGGGYVTFPGADAVRRSADLAVFDSEARVPYAARGTDWVTYESVESASEKAAWVAANGLAGVMTFNLNCDDWAPVTGREKFPLHAAMRRVLENQTQPSAEGENGNLTGGERLDRRVKGRHDLQQSVIATETPPRTGYDLLLYNIVNSNFDRGYRLMKSEFQHRKSAQRSKFDHYRRSGLERI